MSRLAEAFSNTGPVRAFLSRTWVRVVFALAVYIVLGATGGVGVVAWLCRLAVIWMVVDWAIESSAHSRRYQKLEREVQRHRERADQALDLYRSTTERESSYANRLFDCQDQLVKANDQIEALGGARLTTPGEGGFWPAPGAGGR